MTKRPKRDKRLVAQEYILKILARKEEAQTRAQAAFAACADARSLLQSLDNGKLAKTPELYKQGFVERTREDLLRATRLEVMWQAVMDLFPILADERHLIEAQRLEVADAIRWPLNARVTSENIGEMTTRALELMGKYGQTKGE